MVVLRLFVVVVSAALAHAHTVQSSLLRAGSVSPRAGGTRCIYPAAPVLTGEDLRDSLARALDKSPKKYIALLVRPGSKRTG